MKSSEENDAWAIAATERFQYLPEYVPIDCSVDAAAAPSACTTAHPTYRIGVEANEAVVVAALLCLLPFIATNGRRVEKAQRGNAMDDVASVATVVLLIVVRTGELVWTGGIAQQGEVRQAGQFERDFIEKAFEIGDLNKHNF